MTDRRIVVPRAYRQVMDAAEREEHRRYQAELYQRWARWDRRAKWRIRIDVAIIAAAAAVLVTVLLLLF
jgi:hypothetical protein